MQSLNILIVADDAVTAAALADILHRSGHQTYLLARAPAQLLKLFFQIAPDLIVLDIQLTGPVDGIETVRQLLAIRKVPTIVLTSRQEEELFSRIKKVFTPAAYLTKPFNAIDFPRLVELAWRNFQVQPAAANPMPDHDDSIFLPVGKGFERVLKSGILYISAQKGTHSSYIHEAHKKEPRLTPLSVGYLEQFFTPPDYFRLSRSILINVSYIERIDSTQLKMESSAQLLSIPEATRTNLLKCLSIIRGPKKI